VLVFELGVTVVAVEEEVVDPAVLQVSGSPKSSSPSESSSSFTYTINKLYIAFINNLCLAVP